MRFLICVCAALAAQMGHCVSAGAADGFKASATVSRKVSADILSISFHLIERSESESQGRIRAEETRLKSALQATGATIKSWTSRVSVVNAGFNSATYNYISPSPKEPQAVDMRRDVTVRLSGLKDAEVVAAILGRSGIRHGVSFVWSYSNTDTVREELILEAAVAAVAKAQKLASHTGGKAGAILDLAISPMAGQQMAIQDANGMIMQSAGVFRTTIVPDEIIEEAEGHALILRVTATATVQSKPD